MNWSNLQTDIFNFCETGSGNAIIEAVAGSGKTTTIVEALKRVKGSSIFLAFNKSIAEELKRRGVNARTFHSLTFGPVTKFVGNSNIDTNKTRTVMESQFSGKYTRVYGAFVNKLVGLAKQAGIDCLVADEVSNWMELIEHHDLELETEEGSIAEAVEIAQQILHTSNIAPFADFDDLLYLSVKEGLTLPKFDFVFVDEAQDTNAIQRAILRKIMKPGARMVAVGDPAQAIYGFRGADSDSMDLIAREFNCQTLPLTVSYRCSCAVVCHAQQYVEHIRCAPDAPAGKVTYLEHKWDTNVFDPTDLVVCRTTKPIIELAFRMLKSRKPVKVLGREIGQGLKNLISRCAGKDTSIENMLTRLDGWANREIEKAIAKRNEGKVESIRDRQEAIQTLVEGMNESRRSVPELLTILDTIFMDKANSTTLSTIHKAKGLEANRVFWLNSSKCPASWVKQDWQRMQEINLCYVATTRAKNELVLIEDKENRG